MCGCTALHFTTEVSSRTLRLIRPGTPTALNHSAIPQQELWFVFWCFVFVLVRALKQTLSCLSVRVYERTAFARCHAQCRRLHLPTTTTTTSLCLGMAIPYPPRAVTKCMFRVMCQSELGSYTSRRLRRRHVSLFHSRSAGGGDSAPIRSR